MDKKKKLTGTLELLWWIATFIVTLAFLLPILTRVPDYPFLWPNVIFIVGFITFTRYLFLLKYTFIAKRQVVKVVLVFLTIPAIFLMVEQVNLFQRFLDNYGFIAFLDHLPHTSFQWLSKYIYNEMLFFSTAAVISCALLALRLLISVWRYRNLGKV